MCYLCLSLSIPYIPPWNGLLLKIISVRPELAQKPFSAYPASVASLRQSCFSVTEMVLKGTT